MGRSHPPRLGLGVAQASFGSRPSVVLLVEDEILIRLVAAETLRDEGFTVLEAGNADEAMALVRAGQDFALLITDIRMPGSMDGVALAAAVKEIRPTVPVVLLSSHISPDMSHCADAFLSKPFRPSELYDLVTNLIGVPWTQQNDDRNVS